VDLQFLDLLVLLVDPELLADLQFLELLVDLDFLEVLVDQRYPGHPEDLEDLEAQSGE
jgi:hypothetical protein